MGRESPDKQEISRRDRDWLPLVVLVSLPLVLFAAIVVHPGSMPGIAGLPAAPVQDSATSASAAIPPVIRLDQGWRFLPGEYSGPAADVWQRARPVSAPHSWTDAGLPGRGRGTYVLRLPALPPAWQQPALFWDSRGGAHTGLLLTGGSARRLWQRGVPGDRSGGEIPWLEPVMTRLPAAAGGGFLLMIHLSDYHHPRGGLRHVPLLGEAAVLERMQLVNRMALTFVMGVIFMMGVYALARFTQRRRDRTALWLGMYCLCMAGRIFSFEHFIELFFPEPSLALYGFRLRLEYAGLALAALALPRFFHHLFPGRAQQNLLRLLVGLGLAQISLALFSPLTFFPRFLWVWQVTVLLAAVSVTHSLIRAVRLGDKGAVSSALAGGLLLVAALNDLAVNNDLLMTPYLSPYALVVFLFVQSRLDSQRLLLDYRQSRSTGENRRRQARRRTAELLERNRQLELQTDKTKNLVRVLLHDISNPLTRAIGAGDFALDALEDGKESMARKHLVMQGKAMTDLRDIINLVREMEALQSGKVRVNLVPLSVRGLIIDTREAFAARLRAKKQILRVDLPEDDLHILGERRSMTHSILGNLMSNAIKFTPEGGEIILAAGRDAEGPWLSVTDTGMGIPEELQLFIFDPHKHTSRRGTSGEVGTGFGMPIVKTWMDLIGGRIYFTTSTPQKDGDPGGTVFHLRFQEAADEEDTPAA